MIAKLVRIDLMVRVIVPDDVTDEVLDNAVYSKFLNNAKDKSWVIEGISEIENDTECPYNPDYDTDEYIALQRG